jgi:hypothetical protein
MATVNQMMPLSGQPNRFSFHIEINEQTTQVVPRNTISHRLKTIIVSSGCTCSNWPTDDIIFEAAGRISHVRGQRKIGTARCKIYG